MMLKTRRNAAKTPRRFSSLILGWKAKTPLRDGFRRAYDDFLTNSVRER